MLFPVAICPGDENTSYGAAVPDIPGCFSAGDTFDEALVNVREAIEIQMEDLADTGNPIPNAGSIQDHFSNEDFEGWVWALVDFDVTPYLGKSHKINVTLPDLLIKRIDELVERNPKYKTRSGFLAQATLNEMAGAHEKSA